MKDTALKLCEGRVGDLLLKHLNGNSKCSSELKMAILSEIDRGHDADFISGFLQSVCYGSTREFLSESVWTTEAVSLWQLEEKLYFLLFPDFATFRHYCLSHYIPTIHAFKKASKQEGLAFKEIAKKYGYSFKKLLASYNLNFESNDVRSWIEEGGEFVTLCDLFCIKVETLASSPSEWNLSEDRLEKILDDLDRDKYSLMMIKNFARLFSLPPDKWFGKKYFHKIGVKNVLRRS